ncbi:LysR family transcriptional regulator, partial [Pelagibacterales bacterium SAG-MED46]|nr:LysR family transcriptional regulator [Pelagibacterales bacterium SAG-MED46]
EELPKKLNISQPPLSQQIKLLEEKIGFKLLKRDKSHVSLTLAGNKFLRDSYDITSKIKRSILTGKKISRGEIGTLRIGFSTLASFYILPDVISKFYKSYKGVELQLKEMRTENIIKEILDKKIDLGFAGKKIINKDIKSISLYKEKIILAINKNNPLSKKKNISISDVKNENFILFPKSKGAVGLYDKIIQFCKKANFEPNVIQEAYELEVILGLVSGGMGIALIPENSGKLYLNNIIFKEFKENSPSSEIYLLIRKNEEDSIVKNFFNLNKINV